MVLSRKHCWLWWIGFLEQRITFLFSTPFISSCQSTGDGPINCRQHWALQHLWRKSQRWVLHLITGLSEKERGKRHHCIAGRQKLKNSPSCSFLGATDLLCVYSASHSKTDPLTGSSKTSVIQTVRTNKYSVSGWGMIKIILLCFNCWVYKNTR